MLATVMLWIHALAGAIWTGTCACFVIAGAAYASSPEQWRDFAMRTAPRLDRLNLAAAAVLTLSGIVNFLVAGTMRRFAFSETFMVVLAIKIALLVAMAAALAVSWRAESAMLAAGASEAAAATNRIARAYGFTVVAGALALGFGLWLMGS